jgi:hypothetical protein
MDPSDPVVLLRLLECLVVLVDQLIPENLHPLHLEDLLYLDFLEHL